MATTPEQARGLVEAISRDHGCIHAEVWPKMDPNTRKASLNTTGQHDDMDPLSLSTLTNALHTSGTGFLFELLKNADCNQYTEAKCRREIPSIKFKVHPDRIIIDCNEDGFTRDDLTAICDVGKSSRHDSLGNIEGKGKGIGFKSVFMVAWKVHIQSGPYSFSFKHRRGDSGLGMISPTWEEPDAEVSSKVTRMTLLLHGTGGLEGMAVREQFNELQEHTLLFMRNLRSIQIHFYADDGKLKDSMDFASERTDSLARRIRLSRDVTKDEVREFTSTTYHVTKYKARNLAKNSNRCYSPYEEKTKAYSTTDILLAFPLSDDSVPIVKPQDVFAFRPMRHAGFSFLIQSDFVTQANRHDIVLKSDRNQGILHGISEAFVKAVKELCLDPKLEYTWMRFLPSRKNCFYDHFWLQLIFMIETKLRTTRVLRSSILGGQRPISELRQVPKKILTSMDNLSSDQSSIYPENTWTRTWNCFDNTACHTSVKMNSLILCGRRFTGCSRKSEPWKLRGGQWVQPDDHEVYFSNTQGLPIPEGLDLNLISRDAEENQQRKKLFEKLGVCSASIAFIRHRLEAIHKDPGAWNDSHQLASHARYLYTTHYLVSNPKPHYDWLYVCDNTGMRRHPHSVDVYIDDENLFGPGPKELLKQSEERSELHRKAHHFPMHPIHNCYFQDIPEKPVSIAKTWSDWLCSYVGVRRHLRLVKKDDTRKLSDECKYISEHLPDKFFGFLSRHWEFEGEFIEGSPELLQKLQAMEVPCKDTKVMAPMSITYLPLPDLQKICQRFLSNNGYREFPFLRINSSLEGGAYEKEWGFLVRHLGVRVDEDLEFYLMILKHATRINQDEPLIYSHIVELYSTIYIKYCLEPSKRSARIRSFFEDEMGIFVPSEGDKPSKWTGPSDCLWEAPPNMLTKHCLKSSYQSAAVGQPAEASDTEMLLCNVIGIKDCSWRDLTYELSALRDNGCGDLEKIHGLYRYLRGLVPTLSTEEKEKLRNKFHEDALIYVHGRERGWYAASNCLWSSATAIHGMATLDDTYDDLRDLFVQDLDVSLLTAQVVYDRLLLLGQETPPPPVDCVKDHIWALAACLEFSVLILFTLRITESRVFPVRYPNGQVKLCDANTEHFVLIDRSSLGDSFASQVKTLDFTYDEVKRLDKVFRRLFLDRMYLSRMVTEMSTVEGMVQRPSSGDYLNLKAHGLYRIAMHFKSPRLVCEANLYNMLRGVQVFEADDISAKFHLYQDGKDYVSKKQRRDVHIHEENSQLKIFIPRNKRRKEYCYGKALPVRLFDWLITDSQGKGRPVINGRAREQGLRLTTSALNCSRWTLKEILDEEGIATGDLEELDGNEDDLYDIPKIGFYDDDEGKNEQVSSPKTPCTTDMSEDAPAVETPASSVTTPSTHTVHRFSRSKKDTNSPINSLLITTPRQRTSRASRSTSTSSAAGTHDIQTRDYQAILEKIISAARSASFPTKGPFDISVFGDVLASDNFPDNSYDGQGTVSRHRSPSQLEWDKKIGAAGQLYVYELLKSLEPSLPNFTVRNWKSSIRGYVATHPDYDKMQAWEGRETVDFNYEDTQRTLTDLLIDKGYLDKELGVDTRRQYLIDVKSTTGPRNTPFYMSKHQYRRMHEEFASTGFVYVIFRVYNIGGSVGVKVYAQPLKLEMNGRLLFTEETWSVVPSKH